jgi:hypothetical protein
MNQSRSIKKMQYVQAGSQMEQQGRFQVSSHVYLYNEGEREERAAFRAQEAHEGAGRGLKLKWAAVVMVFAVFVSFWMVGSKIALTQELNQAYANLHSRYIAADAEGKALAAALAEKSDASKICYYAVQNLGMRLATHAETIGVTAQGYNSVARLDGSRAGNLSGGK